MKFITKGIEIPSRKLLAITIINSGTLSWHFFFAHVNFVNVFQNFSSDISWIYIGSALFYFFAAFSAIIGSALSSKVNRRKLLLAWITFGVLITGVSILFQGKNFILLFGPLFGITLGLGFPHGLALLADCAVVEERGRVSGILLLQTFIMIILAVIANGLLDIGLIGILLLSIILRSTSFLALVLDECKGCSNLFDMEKRKGKSWFSILTHRSFVLYFFPWVMFIIAIVLTDHLLWEGLPKTSDYDMVSTIARPLRYGGAAIFGLVSGVLADRFGRKPPIMIGLMILGFSFALLGLTISPLSVFIHMMTIGIAFGFLMVIYIAVPSDLAFPRSKEKFYALILVLPLTIYGVLGAVPLAFGISAPANVLFFSISTILFLSVLPVLQAPETLPQAKVRERKMKEYVEKVGKLVEESRKTD